MRRRSIAAMQRGRDWIWIAGNHDPNPSASVGGRFAASLTLGALTFRHQPEGAEEGEIAGHLHPVARVARRGLSVRRRCFACNERRAVMPAFGTYAGGLNVRHRAFAAVFETLASRHTCWATAAFMPLPRGSACQTESVPHQTPLTMRSTADLTKTCAVGGRWDVHAGRLHHEPSRHNCTLPRGLLQRSGRHCAIPAPDYLLRFCAYYATALAQQDLAVPPDVHRLSCDSLCHRIPCWQSRSFAGLTRYGNFFVHCPSALTDPASTDRLGWQQIKRYVFYNGAESWRGPIGAKLNLLEAVRNPIMATSVGSLGTTEPAKIGRCVIADRPAKLLVNTSVGLRRGRPMRRYALRDDQWDRIKDTLPGREGHVGGTASDNRLFVEAVLFRFRAGVPWRDLPERRGLEHRLPALQSMGEENAHRSTSLCSGAGFCPLKAETRVRFP